MNWSVVTEVEDGISRLDIFGDENERVHIATVRSPAKTGLKKFFPVEKMNRKFDFLFDPVTNFL